MVITQFQCVIIFGSVLNHCRPIYYHLHGMEVSNLILVNAQQDDSQAPDCPKRRFHASQTKQGEFRMEEQATAWKGSCPGEPPGSHLTLISQSCSLQSDAPLPSKQTILSMQASCSIDMIVMFGYVTCLKAAI